MDVIMPQLGETVLEGTISAWYKNVGDTVKADEPLFDLETDKVTTEIPAPIDGVLTEILVVTGATVKVGTRLAVIGAAGATVVPPVLAAPVPSTNPMPVNAPVPVTAAKSLSPASAAPESTVTHGVGTPMATVAPRNVSGGAKLSPVVRRLLGENAISHQDVAGTGRDGRVTREDVLAYLDSVAGSTTAVASSAKVTSPSSVAVAQLAPSTPPIVANTSVPAVVAGPDDEVVPLTKIRRMTAAHMVRSKATSPHTLQAVEVNFHEVEKIRRQHGAEWKAREGSSLTYLPFIARAVCLAIAEFPYINSSFGNDELIVHKRVHLGIAVDLNFEGLMVTVMRDAHYKNLRGISSEIARLAKAARNGSLKPDELAGGTYTISNSGSFGTLISAPVINQPQAAILSSDGVHKKPWVVESPDGDVIAIRPIGVVAQSFDHRAFDGAYSAAFLKRLKEIIETRDWQSEL